MTMRSMRRRIQRAGKSAMARRYNRKLGQFCVPYDYVDKTTVVGSKTCVRGAAGKWNPDYNVLADGSIRRAA